ncbi:Microfibrillar-associated protein 1 [Holothuria leucospilota]|uniref:Microfibrillar-associated protein 1 n=1 Tax=Holothuria leucospilota TaxID=206669 RepID=A0A9Q1CUB9_HOLLE|nr:Microfibrillar-associated protein 1 [Holothuria leucospilota]
MDIDIVPEPGGLIIQSTAGAVPVANKKGEMTMQKVKVKRYVPGKRPDYAPESSSSEDEDELPMARAKRTAGRFEEDARLRRLRERHRDADDEEEEDRHTRHRQIHEPEILEDGEVSEAEDETRRVEEEDTNQDRGSRSSRKVFRIEADESSSEEEDLEEEEIEKRRAALRARALEMRQQEEEDLMGQEDEKPKGDEEESEEESSEYEDYSDSEEETGPRLKPVFVPKRDRVTIQEKEQAAQKIRQQEEMAKRRIEDRKRETLRMVETEARKAYEGDEKPVTEASLAAVNTDDENGEEEYESWKVRELKRIKRDREEREQEEKEKQELERIRNLTDEQRKEEERRNPRVVTNQAKKGRYKFLQKYYHRGAFFMDEEQDVFKRDVSNPTLEDHFDKKVLPKVMQVKNFGRSGRTKYTHLADQDTSQTDSPWVSDNSLSRKFQAKIAGGLKQSFEKPTAKKHGEV